MQTDSSAARVRGACQPWSAAGAIQPVALHLLAKTAARPLPDQAKAPLPMTHRQALRRSTGRSAVSAEWTHCTPGRSIELR